MRSVRQYEMMIIIDPSQDERTVAPSLDKYLEIVRKENGSVEKVDIWGKRRLEYPINKKDEGIYVVLDLKCESATVLEIDRLLNINDQILRTKVLRKDQQLLKLQAPNGLYRHLQTINLSTVTTVTISGFYSF